MNLNQSQGSNFAKPHQRKVFYTICYFLIPIIFLIVGQNFHRTKYSNDPEYAYLLNGLNIARGKFVGHAENPGTTVQIFSALVIRLENIFEHEDGYNFQQRILKNPDEYIEVIHSWIVILISISIFFLGLLVQHITKQFWPGLLLQTGVLTSSTVLEEAWTKVSPEPFLIISSIFISLIVIAFYHSRNENDRRFPVLFALASGFGLATKVTFLPLILIPLVIFKTKKERITYLTWTLIASLIITLPALPEYPHLAKWFTMLFLHKGTYGQGGIGILDPSVYLSALKQLFRTNPVLVVSSIFALLYSSILLFVPSLKARFSNVKEIKYVFAISLAQVVAIMIVAKHYHSNHYLVPVQCLLGLNWFFIILLMRNIFNGLKYIEYLKALIIILFVGIASWNYPYLKSADYGYRITNEEFESTMKKINFEFPDYLKAWYYPTSINQYSALRWGNVYSRGYNLQELKHLYPGVIFFDLRKHSFMLWETTLNTQIVNSIYNGKILLIGGPLDQTEEDSINKSGISLTPIYKGRTQAIFKINVTN